MELRARDRQRQDERGRDGQRHGTDLGTLYRLMFDRNLPEPGTTYMSNEEALVKLISDKSIDVVAIVAGQPAKLLVDMKPEARQLIKLLKVDPDHPTTQAALKTYFSAIVRASSYPSLLSEDLPALAVKAFLVTYDFNPRGAGDYLRRFAQSLCSNFPVLREKGHPKWRRWTSRYRRSAAAGRTTRSPSASCAAARPCADRPSHRPVPLALHAAGADPGLCK